MIECHIGICEYHICHTDLDDGPFCSLGECVKTLNQIVQFAEQLGVNYDRPSNAWREAYPTAESVSLSS